MNKQGKIEGKNFGVIYDELFNKHKKDYPDFIEPSSLRFEDFKNEEDFLNAIQRNNELKKEIIRKIDIDLNINPTNTKNNHTEEKNVPEDTINTEDIQSEEDLNPENKTDNTKPESELEDLNIESGEEKEIDFDKNTEKLIQELENARSIYAKKFIEQNRLNKIKDNIYNFFGKKDSILEEKNNWIQARENLIKELLNRKKTEIGEIDNQDKLRELQAYQIELYEKYAIEEQANINTERARHLTDKKSSLWKEVLEKTMPLAKTGLDGLKDVYKKGNKIWKKSGDWGPILINRTLDGKTIYQYKLGQLVRSGILFGLGGGTIASGASLGIRLVRSIAIGMGGAYGLAQNEKSFKVKIEKIENDTSLSLEEIENKKRKAKILHDSMKVVIVGLMVGGNIASAKLENNLLNDDYTQESGNKDADLNKEDKTEQESNSNIQDKENNISQNETQDVNQETQKIPEEIEIKKSFVVEVNSRGSIATIEDLKSKLRIQYPNIDEAPENIKHILNTNSVSLSQEWGMFNPNQAEESAFMLKGSNITIDEEGKITLHNFGKGDTVLSGENAQKYNGEMFNSDKVTDNSIQNEGGTQEIVDDEEYPDEKDLKKYDDYGNEIKENVKSEDVASKNTFNNENKLQRNNISTKNEPAFTPISTNDAFTTIPTYDQRGYYPGAQFKNPEIDQGINQETYEFILNQEIKAEVDEIFGKRFLGAPISEGEKTQEWLYLKNASINMENNGDLKLNAVDGEVTRDTAEGRIYRVFNRMEKFIKEQKIKPNAGEKVEDYLKRVAKSNIQ